MPEDDLLPTVVVYVTCVQNGAAPTCSVLYSKSKSGSFRVGVWYVPWQLVLVCSSALCQWREPDLVMGWMRRNPIICECVLSCCGVLLTVLLLLTIFSVAALFWIFSQRNILNKSTVRILDSMAQSNMLYDVAICIQEESSYSLSAR